jgi:asparagine synthase (glutamine-hydrolysing)
MCGIAGAINLSLDKARLDKDLYHRGPDEQSDFSEGNLRFYHYRLSILDIACGKQPMHYEHLTIIFNGELFNHLEIRGKYGFTCRTRSDTETILHAYAKLGPACLGDFDGMYVFAIYDRRNRELFLARDRAGKKPLYYYSKEGHFVFASELNALRHQLPLTIHESAISRFVEAGYFYGSATPYREVHELRAGTYLQVPLAKPEVKLTRWWSVHSCYRQHQEVALDAAIRATDSLLHQSVRRRVESSDLEVGSFLSGGIDSGIVTAIAKEYNQSLKTFTVSFDNNYDEAPMARLVAKKYQTQHHEIKISFDNLKNEIEEILCNYGEPFWDSSAIPSYYVSKEARKHLTVILNGDGGDELFGGYRRYVPFARYDFFKTPGWVRAIAGAGHAILPISHDKMSKYNYIYRLLDFARKKDEYVYFSSTLDIFDGFEKYLISNHTGDGYEEFNRDFHQAMESNLSGLEKIMNLDFDNILTSNLLVKMDIATMAHSLEGRSPLLSKELMEYVPTLPDKFKIQSGQTKYLLRKLAEKYLPAELIHQPKRGFEIPLKKWVGGELRDMIAAYILPATAYCHQYVEPAFIEKLWQHKVRTGDEKRAKMIWSLFVLEVWHRKVYKGL